MPYDEFKKGTKTMTPILKVITEYCSLLVDDERLNELASQDMPLYARRMYQYFKTGIPFFTLPTNMQEYLLGTKNNPKFTEPLFGSLLYTTTETHTSPFQIDVEGRTINIVSANIPTVSEIYTNNNSNLFTVQVSGNFITVNINIEGRLDIENGEWVQLGNINLTNFDNSTTLNGSGLYNISVAGVEQIRINITQVDGTVNVFGRFTDTINDTLPTYELYACRIKTIDLAGNVIMQPLNIDYDSSTGIITIPASEESPILSGTILDFDFYTDGYFTENLSAEIMSILATCFELAWFLRFKNDWVSIVDKVESSSFKQQNRANKMNADGKALLEIRERLASQMRRLEQNAYQKSIISPYMMPKL